MQASDLDDEAFFRTLCARKNSEDRLAEVVRLAAERQLSAEEAAPWLEPMSEAEREEVLALRRWFCRRYPTPLERLAYVRRAYARWRRTLGAAGGQT